MLKLIERRAAAAAAAASAHVLSKRSTPIQTEWGIPGTFSTAMAMQFLAELYAIVYVLCVLIFLNSNMMKFIYISCES